MKEVKVYESNDGKRFETFAECVDYELRSGIDIPLLRQGFRLSNHYT